MGFSPRQTFDLNLAILTHCTAGDLLRINRMKTLGTINAGNKTVHITLLINPGDFCYVDELTQGWRATQSITVLEMPSPDPIPKINGYYLWLKASKLKARWHGRVDDDSMTDLSAALEYLDTHHHGQSIHLATGPVIRQEHQSVFVRYLLEKGTFLDDVSTEYESSFTSREGMEQILNDPVAYSMLVETGAILKSPGDRALAFAAHLARVPVIENHYSKYSFHIDSFTSMGGSLHHIHYVPWHNEEVCDLITAFTSTPQAAISAHVIESLIGVPARYYTGGRIVHLISLLSDQCVVGFPDDTVSQWDHEDGELYLIGHDESVLLAFSSYSLEGSKYILHPSSPDQKIHMVFDPNAHGSITESNPGPRYRPNERRPELFLYCRLGYDRRIMRLEENGTITEGSNSFERKWTTRIVNGMNQITIKGDRGETCVLDEYKDGIPRGIWLHGERMPTALIPIYK